MGKAALEHETHFCWASRSIRFGTDCAVGKAWKRFFPSESLMSGSSRWTLLIRSSRTSWRRKKRRGAYQNHVSIAMGSQGELDTELEIAFRNGFLQRENCARSLELCGRVGLLLNRLHDSLD